MCARRFLFVIFILILIVVGGAFAIYQWGGEALVRMATPVGHYQEPARGSGPDYSRVDNWIAHPGLTDDPSQWRPENDDRVDPPAIDARLFYIHPTTYLLRDRWNAPILPGGEAEARTRLFVQSQASAFNQNAEIWAPRYRQAAYGAFLLKSEDAQKALELAYSDVAAAFDVFVKQVPAESPIILAGHSQGSMHLLRLLAERKDRLKGRLVAAYVVGWPVSVSTDLPATGLPPCATGAQAGCVLSWQSFREPANADMIMDAWEGTAGLDGQARKRADMLCVNPISGVRDAAAAPTADAGMLVPSQDFAVARIEGRTIGAHCERGLLIADGDVPNLGPYVLPGNNYHVYDYALFWGAVRADAERRLAAWRAR
jgi:hypothetical protein